MEEATNKAIIARLLKATKSQLNKDLADILEVSPQAISRASGDGGKVPPSWAIAISEQYNVSLDWILFGRGTMSNDDSENDAYISEETARAVIQRLMTAANITQYAELADILGLSRQAVSHAVSRDKIPHAWAIEVAEKYNTSLDWLLLGREDLTGSRLFVDGKEVEPCDRKPTISELQDLIDKLPDHNGTHESFIAGLTEFILIPMVDAVLAAGSGSLQTDGSSSRKYAFRSDFLLRKGSIKDMVIMRVEGESMEPYVRDGDVVLIDQSQTAIRPSSVYAVGIEDAIYLKQIDAEPGKLLLKSYNERYAPIEVDTRGDLADLVRIIGRIVWSSREW